jgi:hypothetical protein
MNQTKALEHTGVLFLANESKDVNELWFIAKSNNDESLAKVWKSWKKYGCEYDVDIMQKISEIESKLYVQSLLI